MGFVSLSIFHSPSLAFLLVSFINLHAFIQLLHYLKHVHFTNEFGEETKFDDNGDPAAMYDLINWQLGGNREVQYVTVGRFDETMQPKLVIEETNIIWNGNQRQVILHYLLLFNLFSITSFSPFDIFSSIYLYSYVLSKCLIVLKTRKSQNIDKSKC